MAEEEENISDEEAILKIAAAMKDSNQAKEDKQSIHTFLFNVATADDTKKIGNLRNDKDFNELGIPPHNVRGSFELGRISSLIMDNDVFAQWFNEEAENTLATSLSSEGFLIKQATTVTKNVSDMTPRRKINKGWFGKSKIEESGGEQKNDKTK